MKKSKKIDDIFRRNLDNVKTPPPADVWQNILDQLPEEKTQKRVLPFWYPLAGAAAAIVIFITIFNQNDISPSPRAATVEFTNSVDNVTLAITISSSYFEEAMFKSSIMLEAARLYTRNSITSSGPTQVIPTAENSTILAGAQKEKEEHKEETGRTEADLKSSLIANTSPLINPSESSLEEDDNPTDPEFLPEQEILLSINNSIAEEDVKDKSEEKNQLHKRFSITTTAGAVYFDNLGKGNAVNAQLSNHESSGNISMSYGVNLAYQVSENIKIRSGLNKVEMSHDTRNVDFAAAASSGAAENREAGTMLYSSINGNLNQQLGFLEVPLEVEYALIDRKLGLSLIGGGSALFLEENVLRLDAANFSADLGEANNLKNTSYSANLGIGMHYNISSQFRFNVEPIFKYQINTFTHTSNFNPYYFGVYSGLSFKF